jgi:UTP--glucose-1-phosphate uridylyltransferase
METADAQVRGGGPVIIAGKFIEDRIYKVKGLVEKPRVNEAPSNIAILGRYIISPQIFDILQTTIPGAGGEIQLTDALKELLKSEAMYAYNFVGRRYDVGDKLGFLEATVEFALKRDDIKQDFMKYLLNLAKNNSTFEELYREVATDKK